MQPDDRERILHMLDACSAISGFIEGRRREDLDVDQMLMFAIIRGLEVIGEAAARLSAETQRAIPEVPWRRVRAMRNRLIHAYFAVDTEAIWQTATDDVPILASALRKRSDD